MKKVLLIVALVLCVAIAGTALAATVYYDASNERTGTVTADKYVILSLDGSSSTTSILLNGSDTIYKIHCGVETSATNEANGTLTVALLPDTANSKTLAGVTVSLYDESGCGDGHEVLDSSNDPIFITGTGNFSVEGIDTSTDYWVKIHFAGAADADALAAIGGSMTIDFVQVD